MHPKNLTYYLEKLENLVDLTHVQHVRDLQSNAFAFKKVDHIPTVINYTIPVDEWPQFGFAEIFKDREKMLLNELRPVYSGAKIKDDRLYGIRANYGTGIIASMFGCPVHVMDHSLPIGLAVDRDKINNIITTGIPDLNSGIMNRVYETAAWFREQLAPYPKLRQAVGSQCFDIQGPFDNASIVWGSSIYMALYDEPEIVVQLMEIITNTIIKTIEKLREIDDCPINEHDGAWNFLGGACVRNDSSINLSRDHYLNYVKTYDEKIIQQWNGWIHFCGDANHWWQELLTIQGLKAINPYQGEFYNLFEMFEKCEIAGIPIVQWTTPLDKQCQERIRTGFSRIIEVEDYETACRFRDQLHKTGHSDM